MSVPASQTTVPRGLLPLCFLVLAIAGLLPFRKEASLFLIALYYSASLILTGVGLTQSRTKAFVVVVITSCSLCKRSLSPRHPLVPKSSGLFDRARPDCTVAAVDLYSGTKYRARCPPMEGTTRFAKQFFRSYSLGNKIYTNPQIKIQTSDEPGK